MSAILQVDKYFEALQRLIDRGEKINNDTVALEAGSGRGSIKRSRPAYAKLIAAIDIAAHEQAETKAETDPMPTLRQEKAKLRQLLDGALEREIALLSEVYSLREEVAQLREQLLNKPLIVPHNHKKVRVR